MIRSLRRRLIVLALAVVAPFVIERGHDIATEYTEAKAGLLLDASHKADLAEQNYLSHERSLRAFLGPLTRALTPADPACSTVAEDVVARQTLVSSIAITNATGVVVCSSQAGGMGRSIADRDYFRRAIYTRTFAISDVVVGRISAEPRVLGAQPVLDGEGGVSHVVLASINIADLAQGITTQGQGIRLTLITDGVSVASFPPLDKRVELADFPLSVQQRVLARAPTTASFDTSADRVFATAPFGTNSVLIVERPAAQDLSAIREEAVLALLAMAIAALIAVALAWGAAETLFLRPVRDLTALAERTHRADRTELLTQAAMGERVVQELGLTIARALDRLEDQASIDPLTGIANRRRFTEALQASFQAGGPARPVSLLLIDVDHFKSYNDHHGHPAGDQALRAVASALGGLAQRRGEVMARIGGEEFALVLPGIDGDAAAIIADGILERIERLALPHRGTERGLLTVSIGFATALSNDDPDLLIASADAALYRAKDCGRHRAERADAPRALAAAS